jgi:hypothetical protein
MKIRLLTIIICWVYLSSVAAIADECIEGDCVNGRGTMVYKTGHKFTGGFQDGMRHGEGVLLMPGNRKMTGVWEKNEIRKGTFWGSDGSKYVGQWQYRERNGRGTLTYPDGREYVGDFKSGQRHGKGTMTYPDGRTYVGDFVFGARTGRGTMTYPDGKKYSGGFKDGERHGQGVLVYPDGTQKAGEFENGEFVGKNG